MGFAINIVKPFVTISEYNLVFNGEDNGTFLDVAFGPATGYGCPN